MRIVPSAEREEFVNAGVVLHCPELGFLECRVHLDEARLRALWPAQEIALVRQHLEAFPKICAGDANAGPIAQLSRRERFHWIVAPRSTVIQVSAVHSGVCDAPQTVLDELFERLVRTPERTRWAASKKPDEPARIEPVTPPYAPEVQAVFDKIMPPGVPPLALFTTLARVPRIYDRFRAGSLLDRGPVSLRHREIVIDRTCARCGCAYEWGVHVAFFGERAGLTAEQIRATVQSDADDAWSEEERLLIRLVDELHDTSEISDELWQALASAFGVEQIFELIALTGFYHTVSFFANGFRLGAEPFAKQPPALLPRRLTSTIR